MRTRSLLILTCAAVSASSMIIRHDRPDARYQELAKKYPAAVLVRPDNGGTLIAPQWVLTAAHVAEDIPRRRFQGVIVAGREYAITKIVRHPQWREMGPHDIALLKLDRPVQGVKPALIYRGKSELGMIATLVGNGDFGTGLTGPKHRDFKRRAVTNRVDRVDRDWIILTFDEPGSKNCTDLEGIPGPGDSGGGALATVDGKQYVIGVSVFGNPGRAGRGTYGATDGFSRVSTDAEWIAKAMKS